LNYTACLPDAALEAAAIAVRGSPLSGSMSRDIETHMIRSIVRSVLIALAAFLIPCSSNANEPEICYSKFSPAKKPEFKHALTEELKKLHDTLGDAYNDDDVPVIDITIAQEGSVYLASSCGYAASLQKSLDKSILFTGISKGDYERVVDLASQSGRIIRMERN
jgi:hypothetical protein